MTPRRPIPFALLAALLLGACGGGDDEKPGFAGRFRGTTVQGVEIEIDLSVSDSGMLTGTSRSAEAPAGLETQLEGRVEGNRATGTMRAPFEVEGVSMERTFEATRDGDRITWVFRFASGSDQAIEMTAETTRVAASDGKRP